MSHLLFPLVEKPAHVPAERVFPIDFTAPPGGENDVHLAWKRLQDATPEIVWTPHNGGHWIMMRAEDIEFVQRNPDPFSIKSVTVPPNTTPITLLPLETDPPEHAAYRMIISPMLAPKVIAGLQDDVRKLAIELIEGFHPKGGCEFVADFSLELPIMIFLNLAGLPAGDRAMLLGWAAQAVRPANMEERYAAFVNMMGYLDDAVAKRRQMAPAEQGSDIIAQVIHAKLGGRPLDERETRGMLVNFLFGGLDTVAASMTFFAYFLARNPERQRQLVDHPELIPNAVEELLRRHGVSNTGRVLTRDFDYKNLLFKKGDCVLSVPILANLDERRFENPLDVDFERRNVPHFTFGNGPKKCAGAMLARSELRIFLEEWLKRIPEFEITRGANVPFSAGLVNIITRLPLSWNIGR